MSAVNLSEVVAKLVDHGMPADAVHAVLEALSIEIHSFDRDAGYAAGKLRRNTRAAGLSLGDRACLALAIHLGTTAVTADRAWGSLPEGTARITMIR